MEVLFKKYFWAIKLLGYAGAMGLAASAISTQLGTRYLLDASGANAPADGDEEGEGEEGESDEPLDFGDSPFGRKAPAKVSSTNKSKLAEQITASNLFCPTCQPIEEDPNAVQYDAEGRPIGPVVAAGETRTGLPLVLMATMESTDPKYSFATVFDQDSEVAGLYGIGDVIRPGVEVTGIDRGMLHMRNGPSMEYLELREGEVKKKAGPKATPKRDKKKKKSSAAIDGAEDAINCPSENLCIVEKSFVESLLQNPAKLTKQARVIPAMKDGETRGFKFYGIRRDSLPKLIGLKNGDMLTAVNGEELTSMDKAMGLYTKLRHASNLSVTIERKGQTINKEIQIK